MKKRKILFLGETFRADAITWTEGLKEFGDFEIVSWELKTLGPGTINRFLRILEYCFALFSIKKLIRSHKPDMIIAERTTSYGFLAALCGVKPIAIAQQGITDLWPETSPMYPIKKRIQNYAFRRANLIHAWGKVMTPSMEKAHVDMRKVLVLPKGINLNVFEDRNTAEGNSINAIVTRSLEPEYRHDIILKAFGILNEKGYDFKLTIVGRGSQLESLKALSRSLDIADKVVFTGKIQNHELPVLLNQSNYYISMPVTEGVSASLFEAMASRCYPLVTDIAGNQNWIRHRENGQLIAIDDDQLLASELIWAMEHTTYREKAVAENRRFIEEKANYSINMKIIAEQYHALINTVKKN